MPNQLKTPFLAFYAGRQYRDAFFRWSGTGCAYLLVLSALCWIPTALSFQKALSVFVGKSAPGIVSQLPEMTFRSGELAVNARQPYTVVNPATGQPLAVIDTTGAIKSLNETRAILLVTKREVQLRSGELSSRSYDLKGAGNLYVNQQKVASWLDMVRSFLVPAMFPVLLGCSFALRALLAFACAVLAAPLARRFGLSTTLESRMRLAVLAASPAIVLRTVLDVAGVSLPYEAPSFFLVTLCYLYFGLRACRSLTADSPASA